MNFKHQEKGSLQANYILQLLQEMEEYFSPPLSEQLLLPAFANKLQQNAHSLLLIENDNVQALLFYYLMKPGNSILYIPFFCSKKSGLGHVIYRELINSKSPEQVKLEVQKNNKKAIEFYKRQGFMEAQQDETAEKLTLIHYLH
jgi:hypothetical protein